ncbi:hypothetical protein D9M72_332420 [compost metagenome]
MLRPFERLRRQPVARGIADRRPQRLRRRLAGSDAGKHRIAPARLRCLQPRGFFQHRRRQPRWRGKWQGAGAARVGFLLGRAGRGLHGSGQPLRWHVGRQLLQQRGKPVLPVDEAVGGAHGPGSRAPGTLPANSARNRAKA